MGVQKLPRRHFGVAIQTSPKAAVPKPFLESLAYFEASEAALCEAVLAAVRRRYTHMRKTLRGLVSKDEFSRIAPAVESLDDLAPLIAFAGLEVHAADRRGADLGFRFEVAWEEEHGLGVRVRGAKVVLIGDDDAAACDWTKAAATIKNFGDGLGG